MWPSVLTWNWPDGTVGLCTAATWGRASSFVTSASILAVLAGSEIGVSVRNTTCALSPACDGKLARSRSCARWDSELPPVSLSWKLAPTIWDITETRISSTTQPSSTRRRRS